MLAMTNFTIREDGYIHPYGGYWDLAEIASIVARAYRDHVHPESLDNLKIHVSELSKTQLGCNAIGCHDTLYSVTVLVTSTWNDRFPTAEQVRESYNKTNASFEVERIYGGYHFYKVW